jgi:hypothetical protein
MTTLIIITNQDNVINSPCVYIVKDGKHTGSSTSLGFDKSEKRALQIANEYKEDTYHDAEIVNLYHCAPTARQYADYIAALTEYYKSWEENPRYNPQAPELMTKCATIKRGMLTTETPAH